MNTTASIPAAADPPQPAGALAIACLLAFTAGFVDTCGFILLFGLFTAHVTGNFVLIGAALAAPNAALLAKLLAFPTFIVTVALTQLYVFRCKRRGVDAAVPVLACQAVLLALFLATGVWQVPITDANGIGAIAVGMLGVAAMAVQNTASHSVFTTLAPTTVMTGNVTRAVIDSVELMLGASPAPVRARLRKMLPPVGGFGVGAIIGGLACVKFGFACLLLPLTAVVSAILLISRTKI